LVVFTAALIAVPAASAIVTVPAVTVSASAIGTGLMAISELLRREACKSAKKLRPPTSGGVDGRWHQLKRER
jgi:hypothetical protein